VLGEAADQEEGLARRGAGLERAGDELGDDLVGARAVDEPYRREVEDDDVHAAHTAQLGLDGGAHGAARGTGHQVVVELAEGAGEDPADVDLGDHRASCASAGMTSCTWAPGNGASPSASGTSWSHGGTMAMRAVPLRMLSFPCHRTR